MKKFRRLLLPLLLFFLLCTGTAHASQGAPQQVLDARSSVVRILTMTAETVGMGSGFAIGDGSGPVEFIVTSYHVVAGDPQITVFSDGGARTRATVYATLPASDLAVLMLQEPISGMQPLPLYTGDMEPNVGATAYALGLPGAADDLFKGQLTLEDLLLNFEKRLDIQKEDVSLNSGIISGARTTDVINNTGKQVDVYQIEVPINSGNSGGPLLSANAEVLGVNAFGLVDGVTQNMNAAVSIHELIPLLREHGIPYTAAAPAVPAWLLPVVLAATAVCAVTLVLLYRKRRRQEAMSIALLYEKDRQLKGTDHMNNQQATGNFIPLEPYLASRGRIPYEMAVYLLAPVAYDLSQRHARWDTLPGLSPADVMVDPLQNRAYLRPQMQRQAAGDVVVHPGYSAPEAYRADQPKGPSADVYALAALLYRAVFGAAPPDVFSRQENDGAVVSNIASLAAPDSVKAALTRALCLDAALRPQNAREYMELLDIRYYPDAQYSQMAAGTASIAPKKPKRKIRWGLVGGLGAIAAAAIIAVVLIAGNAAGVGEAKRLVEQGRYALAVEKMDGILFWDSSLNDTYSFAQAGKALQDGDYESALSLLESLESYPGAQEMKNQALYQKAMALLLQGELGEMRLILNELGDYQDAKSLLRDINTQSSLQPILYGYWETDSGYYFDLNDYGLDTNIPGGADEGYYEIKDGILTLSDEAENSVASYEIWSVSLTGDEFVLYGLDDGYYYTFHYAE